MNYADQVHAIAALPLLASKIIIHTDADLTPKGKRMARWVRTTKDGRKCNSRVRWYVGGKIYRDNAPAELTAERLKGR